MAAANAAIHGFPQQEITAFVAAEADDFHAIARLQRIGLIAEGHQAAVAILQIKIPAGDLQGDGTDCVDALVQRVEQIKPAQAGQRTLRFRKKVGGGSCSV